MAPEPGPAARAFAIAERAFGRPVDERARFVAAECGGDRELERQVLTLLARDDTSGDFLDGSFVDDWAREIDRAWLGRLIGPYRIVRALGAGGMSRVFLGRREAGDFEQEVAIKLLRSSMDSAESRRRFRSERRFLAALEHPNIARLLDGGATEDGAPYLVLEHVRGEPITRYCDHRRLGVRPRIELFRKVCGAVQSAHQMLVIHRDIKPSNVLVTDAGEPKLLDFGIAKLLAPADDEERTRSVHRVLTPDFASPEQLAGEPVSTATDTYSLGVVLYLLLTGALPGGGEAAPGTTRAAEAPSAAIRRRAGDADAAAIAGARATSPAALARQLAGDLDTVVLKALAPDPAERYASVDRLDEDLRRALEGLPILARPPRLGYRVRKFVRRRLGIVAAVGLAAAALLALAITSSVQSHRLEIQRDQAERERSRARAVTDFLIRAFEQADPTRSRRRDPSIREALDRAVERLPADLEQEPEVAAELLHSIGVIYRGLGIYDRSIECLRAALDRRVEFLGELHGDTGWTLRELSLSLRANDELEAAEAAARRALAAHEGSAGEEAVQDLRALAQALWSRAEHEQAEEVLRDALRRAAIDLPAEASVAAEARVDLALVLEDRGQLDEAEALYKTAIATLRRAHGDAHPLVASALNNHAFLQRTRGDLEAAETTQLEVVALMKRIYGERHPEVASALNNLGLILETRGRMDEAEALAREVLAIHREVLGNDSAHTARALNNLALMLEQLGRRVEALPFARESVEVFRAALGDDHPEVALALANLGTLLARMGRTAEAETALRDARAHFIARLGPDDLSLGPPQNNLAKLLLETGRAAEAREIAESTVRIYSAVLPAGHWRTAVATSVLAACWAAEGRTTDAETALLESIGQIVAARGESNSSALWARERLAELYRRSGRSAEAVRLESAGTAER